MIHHIGISCPKRLQAVELRFWEIIGFAETGPARRGKRRVIRWLVGDGCAVLIRINDVEIHVHGETKKQSTDYISIIRPDIERTVRELQSFDYSPQEAKPYFGYKRYHVQSPSGRWIELLEGSPSMKAYAPLEEGEEQHV